MLAFFLSERVFMSQRPVIALTSGDIAGIGPEIIVKAVTNASLQQVVDCVILGHPEMIRRASQLWAPELSLLVVDEPTQRTTLEASLKNARQATIDSGRPTVVCINHFDEDRSDWDVTSAAVCEVSAAAGHAAFCYLTAAIRMTQASIVDAIATAPLNKEALHSAGHHFPGHTEILADRCGVTEFAMMLHLPESAISPLRQLINGTSADITSSPKANRAACGLSVAHVTLHTSVASVPGMLNQAAICQTTELMHGFLNSIGCERVAIGVAALNPHGGENGLFGTEERQIIQPAVVRSQRSGIAVLGPLPIDTLIRRSVMGEFDGVIAMYHDQGHIPVKLLGFDSAINITLGLPIIRTSPTHGTAFDKAWNKAGLADASGMIEAIRMAGMLVNSKRS